MLEQKLKEILDKSIDTYAYGYVLEDVLQQILLAIKEDKKAKQEELIKMVDETIDERLVVALEKVVKRLKKND